MLSNQEMADIASEKDRDKREVRIDEMDESAAKEMLKTLLRHMNGEVYCGL